MRDYEDMSRAELVRIIEQKDEELEYLQSKLEGKQTELEKLQDVTWPEPTPAFVKDGDINRQLLHIVEECGEASKELRKWNKTGFEADEIALAKEIIDIAFSCFTALEVMGYDAEYRSILFAETIEKNKKRGYYDVR